MKNSHKSSSLSSLKRRFAVAVLAGLALALPMSACAATNPPEENLQDEMKIIEEALSTIKKEAINDHSLKDMREIMLRALLKSFDPHSVYETAEEARRDSEDRKGEFGGIGVSLMVIKKQLIVIKVMPDKTAHDAGMLDGDVITHVGGVAIKPGDFREAITMIRGKPGTPVVVTVKRESRPDPLDITIMRAIIEMAPVESKLIHTDKGDIGYIKLTTFDNLKADYFVDKAVRDFENRKEGAPSSYILDIRRNSGGLLDQASAIADNFLDLRDKNNNVIVSIRDRAGHYTPFKGKPGDDIHGKPLVVLTDGASISASEILAGTLQDYKRATIIGTKTYGKGSVQTIFTLGENGKGGAARITTDLYYTGGGRTPQGAGITPDIEVVEPEQMDTSKLERETANENMLRPGDGEARESGKPAPKICDLAPGAKEKAEESFIVKARDRKTEEEVPFVDTALACAADFLQGASRLTVTRDRTPEELQKLAAAAAAPTTPASPAPAAHP